MNKISISLATLLAFSLSACEEPSDSRERVQKTLTEVITNQAAPRMVIASRERYVAEEEENQSSEEIRRIVAKFPRFKRFLITY